MQPTIAGFPARRVGVTYGAEQIDIFVVDDLDSLVDRDALLRDTLATEPPYWAHLWVGSRALAEHLATLRPTFGSALDIGCGVGLAGLIAARLGAHTTFVDHSVEALQFVRASARNNGLKADLLQTDLRAPGLRGEFDLCLAADVTYDPILQRALAAFLGQALTSDGLALCAESVRTVERGFEDACRAHGLDTRARRVRLVDDGVPVDVRITEVRRLE